MKIYFAQTPINENFEFPKGLSTETKRISQTEFTLNSATAKIFDRGNSKTSITFTIERAHPSESAADEFALTHAEKLGALSPATLSFETDRGKKIEFENTALSRIKIETNRLITSAYYEFSAQKPKG